MTIAAIDVDPQKYLSAPLCPDELPVPEGDHYRLPRSIAQQH